MKTRTQLAAIGVARGLVFGTAACGGSDAADEPTTTTIAKGGDVDVDAEDGTVKYTDENGNETEMNIDGDGASLPADWPSDLAPPDSVTLITANTSTKGSQKEMTVLGEAEGAVDDFLPAIKTQLTDAGYDITQDTSSSATGGGYGGLTATKGDDEVSVAIADDPASKGSVSITMTVTTAA